MSTPPPDTPDDGDPAPPPPPPGPWRSDALPPHPTALDAQVALDQPPSIRAAVRLMWVGAALSLLGVLLSFTQLDTVRERIEQDEPELTPSEVDAVVAIGQAVSVVIGLVAVGLWLWMASANGKGRSWARTVATVLGGLSVVGAAITLATDATGVSLVTSVISIGLAAVILVLLYRPESSRFYEAHSRAGW